MENFVVISMPFSINIFRDGEKVKRTSLLDGLIRWLISGLVAKVFPGLVIPTA
jgi:hypothetical protein